MTFIYLFFFSQAEELDNSLWIRVQQLCGFCCVYYCLHPNLKPRYIFFLIAKAKDGIDKVQWKAMQMTLNDSTKFVDMLHNVSWEDGLPDDVLRGCNLHALFTQP